jgi:hypothetical protein
MKLPPTKLKLHGVYEGVVTTLENSLKKLLKWVNLGCIGKIILIKFIDNEMMYDKIAHSML